MNEKRQALLDRMIRVYGFEHEIVIMFADLVERWEKEMDDKLETIVKCHEECPVL